MEPKSALIVSLVAAGLAVGIVAVDLQYVTTVTVETLHDGEWVPVGSREWRPLKVGELGCASPTLRVAIDHDGPFKGSFHVWASYHDLELGGVVLEDRQIRVDAGTTQYLTFTVPDSAFKQPAEEGDVSRAHVDIQVDDAYHGVCVEPEADA